MWTEVVLYSTVLDFLTTSCIFDMTFVRQESETNNGRNKITPLTGRQNGVIMHHVMFS